MRSPPPFRTNSTAVQAPGGSAATTIVRVATTEPMLRLHMALAFLPFYIGRRCRNPDNWFRVQSAELPASTILLIGNGSKSGRGPRSTAARSWPLTTGRHAGVADRGHRGRDGNRPWRGQVRAWAWAIRPASERREGWRPCRPARLAHWPVVHLRAMLSSGETTPPRPWKARRVSTQSPRRAFALTGHGSLRLPTVATGRRAGGPDGCQTGPVLRPGLHFHFGLFLRRQAH